MYFLQNTRKRSARTENSLILLTLYFISSLYSILNNLEVAIRPIFFAFISSNKVNFVEVSGLLNIQLNDN